MPKRSNKRGAETKSAAGGVVGAMTQDIELTVEEAEEAAKKVVRAAASALGIATGEVSDEVKALSRKRPVLAKPARPTRTSKRRPKG